VSVEIFLEFTVSAILDISDGVSRHVSRLETVLRHGFLCLVLALSRHLYILSRVSVSHHVS